MNNIVRLSTSRKAKKEASAVSEVQMSGLKLVHKRKVRGRLATMRDIAKLDWTPWEKIDKLGPSAETMSYFGIYCRVSAAIMVRTKAELIETHTKLEHDAVDEMLAGMQDTAERLKALAFMVEAAYLRVLSSASAHYLSGGKFKGVHDMRMKKRVLRRA